MVKIDVELLLRCSSQHLLASKNADETRENFLARVTHMYLQEQNIKVIENLELCRSLCALYLFENKIRKIENLHCLGTLLFLYLQQNFIEKIENLEELRNLTILNLSRNRITVVEGLENLHHLKELWIEYQNLPPNTSLTFKASSILAVASTLKLVNISGNGITDLKDIRNLTTLEGLYAENNELRSLDELVEAVANWKYLKTLKLKGNLVCRERKYRDNIVVNCLELKELDGKPVLETYRDFLLNWKKSQELLERKRKSDQIIRPFLESQMLSSRPGSSSSLTVKGRTTDVRVKQLCKTKNK